VGYKYEYAVFASGQEIQKESLAKLFGTFSIA
jgi:hypothetical protein